MYGPGDRGNTQPITYWAPGTSLDDFGELGFSAPVLLYGRWVDKTELATNGRGEEITSSAQVHLTQDVVEKGYLAQGDYTSTGSSYSATPIGVDGARIVQGFSSIPDLRFMEQRRKAFL